MTGQRKTGYGVPIEFLAGCICGAVAVLLILGIINVSSMLKTAQDGIDSSVNDECVHLGTDGSRVMNPSYSMCKTNLCHPEKFCRSGDEYCFSQYEQECSCCRAKYGDDL